MPAALSTSERLLHRFHLLPTPVMDAFGAVIFARALTVGLRRGIFELTEKGKRSLPDLSRGTGLSPEGVRLLADACVECGYLKRSGGLYGGTAEARKWLVRSSGTYLGDLIFYFDSLNSRLGDLEYSLEHGRPREPYYQSFSEADWGTYVRGMANLARLLMPDVIRKIRLPGSGARILDLGGSHGLYALECCRRSPGCRAIVMDFPPALRSAASMNAGGEWERITPVEGDILTAPLPARQDAVFLFNILHGFDEEQNRKLIGRSSETLRGGGSLYILDQMKDAGGRSHLSRFMPLIVGLNLMNEIGGTAYSVLQIREWCAGAATFKVMPLRFPGVTLVQATGWSGNDRVRTP